MDLEWILRIVFLGLAHWILAGVLLQDLVYRKKVIGGKKWPWAVVIIFITCLGSIFYLLFHPQIFNPDGDDE